MTTSIDPRIAVETALIVLMGLDKRHDPDDGRLRLSPEALPSIGGVRFENVRRAAYGASLLRLVQVQEDAGQTLVLSVNKEFSHVIDQPTRIDREGSGIESWSLRQDLTDSVNSYDQEACLRLLSELLQRHEQWLRGKSHG